MYAVLFFIVAKHFGSKYCIALFLERRREKWVIICILQETMPGPLTAIKGILVMIKITTVPFHCHKLNMCVYILSSLHKST